MGTRLDYDYLRAEMPWAGKGHYGEKRASMPANLQHKGWVLVDDRGWRYAVKGVQRVRVCRDHGLSEGKARKLFRSKVDEMEGTNE